MNAELAAQLAQFAAQVDDWLKQRLTALEPQIRDPMLYAVRGGKKLRGFLVLQSAHVFDLCARTIMPAAAAIEAMHSYSLCHDDLPAMDNDDLRRGRASLHKAYDEATAILTGDALHAYSFELLSDLKRDYEAEAAVALMAALARAAGGAGMVLGQAQDIAAQSAPIPLSLAQIKALQTHKTGALFEWSATSGAVLARSDDAALRAYGRHLGLAFQIWDDVLDVIGDAKAIGKATHKDADLNKATFVSHLGLEGAKDAAKHQAEQAVAALECYGVSAKSLRAVAQFAISRKS